MDEQNYGIRDEHISAAELDRRWTRIVAFGVARGLLMVLVVLAVLVGAVWGMHDAISGPALCEHVTCSEVFNR